MNSANDGKNTRPRSGIVIPPLFDPFEMRILRIRRLPAMDPTGTPPQKSGRYTVWELHAALQGTAFFEPEEDEIVQEVPSLISKGQWMLLAPGAPIRSWVRSEDYLGFVCTFDLPQHSEMIRDFCNRMAQQPTATGRLTAVMQSFFAELPLLMRQENPLAPYRIRSGFFSLFCALTEQIVGDLPQGEPPAGDNRVKRAKLFVESHLNLRLSAADVAAEIHLSVRQLNRLFLQQEQCTLADYIDRHRMACARNYLQSNVLSLRQISDALGYSNEYSFNRYFTRREGMAPGVYRRMHRR